MAGGAPNYGMTLARLARQVEIALGDVDLSLPQYRMLGILSDGSSGASALAEKLTVSRPTVTAAVDGLVARGYVARSVDLKDRRRVHHTLTREGELALIEANGAVEKRLAEITDYLSNKQEQGAHHGLKLWQQALDTRREARHAPRL